MLCNANLFTFEFKQVLCLALFFAWMFNKSIKEEDDVDDLTEDDEDSFELKPHEILLHDTADASKLVYL